MTESLSVGIVCPYAYDVPGGVQFHIRDMAVVLRERGYRVNVIVPAEDPEILPEGFTWAGSPLAFRYNGSTARLAVGPAVTRRVEQWLQEGDFDVIHVHEPFAPSVGMMALRQAKVPVVATFHSAQEHSRALEIIEPLVRTSMERLSARIAVSQDARRTVLEHYGLDTIIIPNGVFVDHFQDAPPKRQWQGSTHAPTIAFLGRLNEPRKGLDVLLNALPGIVEEFPKARILVAGNGDFEAATEDLGALKANVEYLGSISEADKAALFSSVDLYIAPQRGGESFGIVLVEAMSAGTTVIASDLAAFKAVLDDGRAGYLFKNGDSADLATTVIKALKNPERSQALREHARLWVRQFDWATVTTKVCDVYEVLIRAHPGPARNWLTRLKRRKP